jgi:hypothetical protein
MRSADDRKSEFQTLRGSEKILVALSEFGYLTASQITKLLCVPAILTELCAKAAEIPK